MGKTFESGNIRFHCYRDSVQVTDLTNAGKRGKKVAKFSLLRRSYGGDDNLSSDMTDFVFSLKKATNFRGVYVEAKKLEARGADMYDSMEKGVHVNPAGFQPFKKDTDEFSIDADPRKGYSIRDKRDRFNEPACFGRGKKKDMARFFRWVQDNWDSGVRAKNLTYNQLTSAMLDAGFDFHSYCRMD